MSVEKAEWLFARLLHIEATIFRLKKVFIFEILGFSLQSCLGSQQVKKVNLKSFQFWTFEFVATLRGTSKKIGAKKVISTNVCNPFFSLIFWLFTKSKRHFLRQVLPNRPEFERFVTFDKIFFQDKKFAILWGRFCLTDLSSNCSSLLPKITSRQNGWQFCEAFSEAGFA